MVDLIKEPRHLKVAERLTELVLEDWNPESVETQIRAQSANMEITVPWAMNTNPPDSVRWNLKPDWDYLDEPQI